MSEDKETCWYQPSCVEEMNRFHDMHKDNAEVCKHFETFTKLLSLTDEHGNDLLDIGCGTAMTSLYCKEFKYTGADLPPIISGCAMRNYPKFFYRSCDIINDELSWINSYPVVVLSGVIDIMQDPLAVLDKILSSAGKFIILHRQEITEKGKTHSHQNGSYGGYTYHSVISREDFNALLEKNNFDIVKELPLEFSNWENGGCSFLLRKRKSWSLYHIDHNLNDFLKDIKEGFFIEAGANDGLTQSNSYYFEFYKNWKGMLVEPVMNEFIKCVQNRSRQTIFEHYALVGKDYKKKEIDIMYTPRCGGLMSVIDGDHAPERLSAANEKGERMKVPACTLNYLLEKNNIRHVDILLLDVESYEKEVLTGIDFEKHAITFLVIEELNGGDEIKKYLSPWYECIAQLTHHDYLYKRK